MPDLSVISPGNDMVDSPSPEWYAMAKRWELPTDLMGGTLAMRNARTKWLPREPLEGQRQYDIRLQRGILYEGFKNAIKRLCAKPFSKDVTLKGELPEVLQNMFWNVDFQGTNMTQFCKRLMTDALIYGKTHFLVDFPMTGGSQTRADERFGTVRPFFTHVPARDLIGWRDEVDPVTGERYLTQVRILESTMRPLGKYGSEFTSRVRILEPGRFEVFEKQAYQREYSSRRSGEVRIGGQVATRIPLVTIYFDRCDFMMASPPLEGLAWLNLAHWQSSCDHRNYLRFARIGILQASGFLPEEIEKGIKISPSSLTASTNPNAKLEYVEHGGKAFEAGVKDLEMLEARMEVEGVTPLVEGTANTTARGKMIDEDTVTALAQAWVRAVEKGIDDGMHIAHKFIGDEPDPDFAVDIYSDFALPMSTTSDVQLLLDMRTSVPPQISHETFINEIRRRGTVSDLVKSVDEQEKIAQELLTGLGGDGNGDTDTD